MDISKFDVKMGESRVGTPSLALHIGYSLKKCVGIVRGKHSVKRTEVSSKMLSILRPDVRTWRELSEMVLNRLILFNKRRGGEAARLRVETYTNRPDWQKSTSQDVVASLSGIEQQLFKRYCSKNTVLKTC